jgi:dihydrolipoamide dehydrogenase
MKDKKRSDITMEFDRILVAVGRVPNSTAVAAEKAGLEIDAKGFIKVNERMMTNISGIYAVGDVTGNPMLAHRASHQGKVAAEVIAGLDSAFTPLTIPSVAYTNPEVAWMGLTEKEAAARGKALKKGVYPWSASGGRSAPTIQQVLPRSSLMLKQEELSVQALQAQTQAS